MDGSDFDIVTLFHVFEHFTEPLDELRSIFKKIVSGGKGIADDGSVYLKLDKHQWRIGVHPSEEEGISYIGFEVESETKLIQAMENLKTQNIKVTRGSDEEANARAVTGLAILQDPTGNQVELFYEPTIDYKFSSPISGQHFVADRLGLGHVMIFAADDNNTTFINASMGDN